MRFVDLHTHRLEIEKKVINIYNAYPENVNDFLHLNYISIGIHPWYIKPNYDEHIKIIEKTASLKQVVAIGEAGLDKNAEADYALQKNIFELQANIATKHNKPMIIHAVKSHNDIISIRKKYRHSPPWIIHGCNVNEKTAAELMRHGFYVSFGKDVFNENSNAAKTIKNIAIDKIFFETDDSTLNIDDIYKKAACLLNISCSELLLIVQQNFKILFNIH